MTDRGFYRMVLAIAILMACVAAIGGFAEALR